MSSSIIYTITYHHPLAVPPVHDAPPGHLRSGPHPVAPGEIHPAPGILAPSQRLPQVATLTTSVRYEDVSVQVLLRMLSDVQSVAR